MCFIVYTYFAECKETFRALITSSIFGIWVIALLFVVLGYYDWSTFKNYIVYDRIYIEPLFVVVIMAIASSRPVVKFSEKLLGMCAGLGGGSPAAWWFSILMIAPLLGSFITEPAAITIAALLLANQFYKHKPSSTFAYATIGLLFVNISVGIPRAVRVNIVGEVYHPGSYSIPAINTAKRKISNAPRSSIAA